MTQQVRCPICGKRFPVDGRSSMPFCCERCRLLDLGKWLDEQRSLPVVPNPDDDEAEFEDFPFS